jgi:hypothetical protein
MSSISRSVKNAKKALLDMPEVLKLHENAEYQGNYMPVFYYGAF